MYEELFDKIVSSTYEKGINNPSLITKDCIIFCHKTSRSKKPKPIQGKFYIIRKFVETKWGSKVVVIGLDKEEVWGDADNLSFIPKKFLSSLPDSLVDTLRENLDESILDDCTPAICDVIKKNYAGIEVRLTTGQKLFVSKKIIYPIETYEDAVVGDTISINIPVWFAQTNNIFNNDTTEKS
jgi:hypothetical protein